MPCPVNGSKKSAASPTSSAPATQGRSAHCANGPVASTPRTNCRGSDRKSTRLNSSHLVISYAVFCLKKKKHHEHIHGVRQILIAYPPMQQDLEHMRTR